MDLAAQEMCLDYAAVFTNSGKRFNFNNYSPRSTELRIRGPWRLVYIMRAQWNLPQTPLRVRQPKRQFLGLLLK